MTAVTVVRHVPPPIIGLLGQVRDSSFEAFEQTLDWLETTGTVVERVDPAQAADTLASDVRELLARDGARALPVILVNGSVVSRGAVADRAQLARLVGRSRFVIAGAVVQQLAAVAASAAVGDDAQLRTESARGRDLGITEGDLAMATAIGARRRTTRVAPSAA